MVLPWGGIGVEGQLKVAVCIARWLHCKYKGWPDKLQIDCENWGNYSVLYKINKMNKHQSIMYLSMGIS